MPLYDYHCAQCGGFRLFRPMSESGAAAPCPQCATPSGRVLSAPFLGGGDAATTTPASAPGGGGFRHACGFGCSHNH